MNIPNNVLPEDFGEAFEHVGRINDGVFTTPELIDERMRMQEDFEERRGYTETEVKRIFYFAHLGFHGVTQTLKTLTPEDIIEKRL